MAASSTTATSPTNPTSTDSISQQMDSTRMTTANVSHHNQQNKAEQQQQEQEQEEEEEKSAQSTETLHELLALSDDMELSQIELIYRAEGNANLVLALPQFKKVLRLPKTSIIAALVAKEEVEEEKEKPKPPVESSDCNLKSPQAQSELLEKQKPHKQAEKASVTTERESQSGDDLTMKDFATYIQILRQLLGDAYVLEADICRIHKETDRKWINKHIRAARPAHRLDKEFCGQFGLLLPDATLLPSIEPDILHSNLQSGAKVNENSYAIEIKPKQGWQLLSNPNASCSQSSNIATSHSNIKDLCDIEPTSAPHSSPLSLPPTSPTPTAAKVTKTMFVRCRYCAMQFLKLKNRKISHMNTYCPLELFSGMPSRMLIALDGLFRCPQNNLRVFKNGILIYGDHASSISYEQLQEDVFPGDTIGIVKNLLVECLLRNYEKESSESMDTGVIIQPHTSRLPTVEFEIIQADPDADAETETRGKQQAQETQAVKVKTSTSTALHSGTAEMMTAKTSVSTRMQSIEAEMRCLPKNCILQRILHLQLLVKQHLSAMRDAGYEDHKQRTFNSLSTLLVKRRSINLSKLKSNEQYLLGATALDCSIMITFREIPWLTNLPKSPRLVFREDLKRNFLTKVTALDLDPKPDSHFWKYTQQTKEAYEVSSKC